MGKNVILTGDLNVSRDLIDTAKAEDNMRAEGMTYTEYLSTPNRRVFNQLLMNGQISGERDEGREEPVLYDLCREFHPEREGMYTHWEQKINARPGNFGSRIDFVLCSIAIKDWFRESNIQEGLMGSDHCPVYAVLKDKVHTKRVSLPLLEEVGIKEETHVLDLMNPLSMFKNGIRQREYNPSKDVPSLSGKLLPEFTKRRNIRDMFNRKPVLAKQTPISKPSSSEASLVPEKAVSSTVTNPLNSDLSPSHETSPVKSLSSQNGHTAPTTSPLSSAEKRRAPSASPIKSAKRSRSNLSSTGNSGPALVKGQQSLKGFFQARTKPVDSTSVQDTISSLPSSTVANEAVEWAPTLSQTDSHGTSSHIQTDPLASQEASKEGWTKLFSKKPMPRCEGHAEPCMLLTTKKAGVNCGRQFWMCSRPIGPSGQKETGTQWRCGTFIWASDWKG
jgi:AP endonuclease-2